MSVTFGFILVAAALPLVAIPAGWLLGILVRKLRVASMMHHWRRRTPVYAEYTAPGNLRPAEIAFLYDRSFGEPELLATLFDLELRTMVRLTPVPTKGPGVDFTIELLCKGTEKTLLDFEQEVVLSVKAQGAKPRWSRLHADTAIWDSGIERLLEDDLQQRGYFWHRYAGEKGLPYIIAGIVVSLLTIGLPLASFRAWFHYPATADEFERLSHQFDFLQLVIAVVFGAIVYAFTAYFAVSAYSRGMDVERGTTRLRLLWPHLEGFRWYLQVVEQNRITFANKELRDKAREVTLPYAVALNIRTDWTARFK